MTRARRGRAVTVPGPDVVAGWNPGRLPRGRATSARLDPASGTVVDTGTWR